MQKLLYTFVVYASFTNAVSLGVRSRQEESVGLEGVDSTVDQDQDRTTFSRLLSAVSPRALQQLVHEYVPNGLFSSDHNVVEDIYARSPILATSIVQLAVRQASGNDTSTSDTPTSSSSSSSEVPTTSTSDAPSTTPTEEPTTSTQEPTTSSETPPPETTETPSDTPTPSSSATPTPTPAPTTEPSSTTETPTKTPDPTSSSSTPVSESSSHSDSSTKGSSSAISHPTTAKPTSTTSTFTSTLPGGAVTVVTEVTVVTPGVSEGDNDGTPTTGMGSLQTDSAAPMVRGPGFEIIAGLLLGGVMLA
ncbi:hypothetical protein FHL15_006131 [Xylaria flabelliformis]|uniref:Uncharacterized protein n=1 Tax=Xylaria flabelliformis TaxID=2512241 RepID=A0A553HYI7_9PEZI|nr:hypothetical protein FHL15_006131 [Xylaria flabelliformis]